MNEFKFLFNLKRHFNFDLIGDDCAVLPFSDDEDLLITSDILVEDIDFRLAWADANHIGHKALAVSLSDIAAMGGLPKWSLLSIAVPKSLWNEAFLFDFYRGINELAQKSGVVVAGGDVSESPDKLVVDSIVAGSCPSGEAVLRSGATRGDLVCVSGTLGGAAGGLKLLEFEKPVQASKKADFAPLIRRQFKPSPQLTLGNQLRIRYLASAMIDVSDGFSSDLWHICESSNVGAVIFADKIPVDPLLTALPGLVDGIGDPLELALHGGEDFELLFTAPAERLSEIEELGCTVVGEIVATPGRLELVTSSGNIPLERKGFDHFGPRNGSD